MESSDLRNCVNYMPPTLKQLTDLNDSLSGQLRDKGVKHEICVMKIPRGGKYNHTWKMKVQSVSNENRGLIL